MSGEIILTVTGILLLTGAFSNKLSSRYNLPTLLMFLGVGVVAGTILPFTGITLLS